jgi:hypothetical protein
MQKIMRQTIQQLAPLAHNMHLGGRYGQGEGQLQRRDSNRIVPPAENLTRQKRKRKIGLGPLGRDGRRGRIRHRVQKTEIPIGR